jgi:hypothetical protein
VLVFAKCLFAEALDSRCQGNAQHVITLRHEEITVSLFRDR